MRTLLVTLSILLCGGYLLATKKNVIPPSSWEIVFLEGLEAEIDKYKTITSPASEGDLKPLKLRLTIYGHALKQDTWINTHMCNSWTIAFDGTNPIKHDPVAQSRNAPPTILSCGVYDLVERRVWETIVGSHRYELSAERTELTFFNTQDETLVQFRKREETAQ